jgi:hypothetical protein
MTLRIRLRFVQMLDDVLVGVDAGIGFVIILVHAAKGNPGLELSGGGHSDDIAECLLCILATTGALITARQIEPDLGVIRGTGDGLNKMPKRSLKIVFCTRDYWP